MKYLLLPLLCLALATPTAAETAQKPNIIIIYTDDHGWPDVGPAGIHCTASNPASRAPRERWG